MSILRPHATATPSTRRGPRRGLLACAAVMLVAVGSLSDASADPPRPWELAQAAPPVDLTEAQREARQRELQHFLDDVKDQRLDYDRRLRAAQILIGKSWPEVGPALRDTLTEVEDAAGRRAVANAVGELRHRSPPEELVSPLLDLLASNDEQVQAAAAKALGRYDRDAVGRQLITRATDPERDLDTRRGAILALAEHRNRESAATLIRLTDRRVPAPLQKAAYASLAELTGLYDYGEDRQRWRQWWTTVKNLNDNDFRNTLDTALIDLNNKLRGRIGDLTTRLRQAYQQLYVLTDEKARDGLLAEMLTDPVDEIRMLAADTIQRAKIDTGQGKFITEPLRQAMRQRMAGDPSAVIRARMAQQLRSLKDEKAAEIATDRLDEETEPRVLAALLTMLNRVPRQEAVEPALKLLDRDGVRGAAAGYLLAAVDAEDTQLDEKQRRQARTVARRHLDSADQPVPTVVTLLGRLAAGKADQERISRLMKHPDEAVRLAAADAFLTGIIPLERLLERLDDPVLMPKIIEATTRRGGTLAHAQALLDHPVTEPPTLRQAWKSAILAVSQRLEPTDVVKLDQQLAEQPDMAELRQAILAAATAAAIDAEPPAEQQAAMFELSLRLGQLLAAAEQFDQAGAIFDRLAGKADLDVAARRRLSIERVRLLLNADKNQAAAQLAATVIKEHNGPSIAALLDAWLTIAAERLEDGKLDDAAALLDSAEKTFDEHITDDAAKRIAALRTRLAEARKPPAETTTTTDADAESDSPATAETPDTPARPDSTDGDSTAQPASSDAESKPAEPAGTADSD